MALPVAAIVAIVFGVWALLVLFIFALYQFFKSRGNCSCECAPCGKDSEGGCSQCCISLSEACDCDCCKPNSGSCLDTVCPKKKVSCVDIILCQCCAEPGDQPCCIKLCPCCEGCCDDCHCCSCDCCADCESIKCCCVEIRLVSKADGIRESSSSPASPVEKIERPGFPLPPRTITTETPREDTPQTPVTSRSTARSASTSRSTPRSTARSTSRTELLSSPNSSQKPNTVINKKNRPPLTKASKSETAIDSEQKISARSKEGQFVKSDSAPLPSRLPPLKIIGKQESLDESKPSAKHKTRERKSSELKEVPVENRHHSSPVHSSMQNSAFLNYSYPTSQTSLLDSSYGSSNLSGSFNAGIQSPRPLPSPAVFS